MSNAVRHRRLGVPRLLLVLAALALVAAACGDDDDTNVAASPSSTTAASGTTATTASTATTAKSGGDDGYGGTLPPTSASAAKVELADTTLGKVLVSGGKTLYAFLADTGTASTCYAQCATTWPPLKADGEVAVGTGLDAKLFDTSSRTDGGSQVTVDGHPLYFFASDTAPGDTKGQGIGEKWYVVGADGAMIKG